IRSCAAPAGAALHLQARAADSPPRAPLEGRESSTASAGVRGGGAPAKVSFMRSPNIALKPDSAKRSPNATSTERDSRWAAVVARDPTHDGRFVYAVTTTGIYCRPSSASRLPRPENVRFFDTAEDAEKAGFRASRRAAADRSAAAVSMRRHASATMAAHRNRG